jgi:hypothetical protein
VKLYRVWMSNAGRMGPQLYFAKVMLCAVLFAARSDAADAPLTQAQTQEAIKKLEAAMETIQAFEDNAEAASIRFQKSCERAVGIAPLCKCLKASLPVGVTYSDEGWLVYSEMMNTQRFPISVDFYGKQLSEKDQRGIFESSVQARNKCASQILRPTNTGK